MGEEEAATGTVVPNPGPKTKKCEDSVSPHITWKRARQVGAGSYSRAAGGWDGPSIRSVFGAGVQKKNTPAH